MPQDHQPVPKANFGGYALAIWQDGMAVLSGAAGVLLSFLSVFVEQRQLASAMFAAAALCYILAPYRVWRSVVRQLSTAVGPVPALTISVRPREALHGRHSFSVSILNNGDNASNAYLELQDVTIDGDIHAPDGVEGRRFVAAGGASRIDIPPRESRTFLVATVPHQPAGQIILQLAAVSDNSAAGWSFHAVDARIRVVAGAQNFRGTPLTLRLAADDPEDGLLYVMDSALVP